MSLRRSPAIARLAALILCSALLALSGCAHMKAHGSSTSPVLDRILKNQELVVGTAANMPPLNMTTKDGQIIGLEPDLAQYLADTMNVKLKMKTMQFSELLGALKAGEIDMVLSSMSITPERNLQVAFAGPYFVSGKCVLTKMNSLASIDDASDINRANLRIVALDGSTSEAFVEEVIPEAKLQAVPNYDAGVASVLNGGADVMIADYPICLVTLALHPDSGLVSVITRLTYEPIGIALPANDPLLLNFIDNTLQGLAITGRLEDLQQRWFEDGSWLEQLK